MVGPRVRLPSTLLLFLTSVSFRHCPSRDKCHFVRFFCPFLSLPLVFNMNLCSLPSQQSIISIASATPTFQHFDINDNLRVRYQLSQNAKKSSVSYPPYIFFRQQMADVPATKLNEGPASAQDQRLYKEKKKNYTKKWTSTSRERQKQQISQRKTMMQSGERRREKAKQFTQMAIPFTPSPQIRTVTVSGGWKWTTMTGKRHYWSSTTQSLTEDRRHRSASGSVEKSAERREKSQLTNRPSSTDNTENRLSISSKTRKDGTTATKSHQKPHPKHGYGGGKAASNWRTELSSTEQSIAMMVRCQELDTHELLPSATTCRNLRSDKVCNYLFQEIETKTGRRDVKCNLQGLEDIAESCRKTCGICCEDINFACEDDQNGIVDCSRQLDKCHQKKWFAVLSRFCAGSCGLCAMSFCRDYDNSCRVRKSLCLKQESLDYMRENCARTCGFCVIGENSASIDGGEEGEKGTHEKKGNTANGKGNSGKPVVVGRPPKGKHRLVLPECTDKADNCTTNAHLCNSPHLEEFMLKFCTKTCLKCGEAQTSKANGDAKSAPGPPPIELIIEPMVETDNEKHKNNVNGGRNRNRSRNNSSRGRRKRECVDKEQRCTQWKGEGLCGTKNGTKFNEAQRRACSKACGDCE